MIYIYVHICMCTYMAAPASFKTPIVNVTHSERRHIAAFIIRGVRGRVLCAKTDNAISRDEGNVGEKERESSMAQRGREKET